ncbi:MAG: hypothetical protein IPM29_09480 [Planctomycetes bacterium]|nr:hypothetical protein [Planctomycetota bacterium]
MHPETSSPPLDATTRIGVATAGAALIAGALPVLAPRDGPESPGWSELHARLRFRLDRGRFERWPPAVECADLVRCVVARLAAGAGSPGAVAAIARAALRDLEHGAPRLAAATGPVASASEAGDPSVDVLALLDELRRAEDAVVAGLPREEARAVYRLRTRQGLPFAEIATRVGRRRAAAARLIFLRARRRVADLLSRSGDLAIDARG